MYYAYEYKKWIERVTPVPDTFAVVFLPHLRDFQGRTRLSRTVELGLDQMRSWYMFPQRQWRRGSVLLPLSTWNFTIWQKDLDLLVKYEESCDPAACKVEIVNDALRC
jgi:hypothetical protein